MYREEFERFEREHPGFHFRPTLSRAGDRLDRTNGSCTEARIGGHRRPARFGCLHLRTESDGGRCTRYTEGPRFRPETNHFREVRLNAL